MIEALGLCFHYHVISRPGDSYLLGLEADEAESEPLSFPYCNTVVSVSSGAHSVHGSGNHYGDSCKRLASGVGHDADYGDLLSLCRCVRPVDGYRACCCDEVQYSC